MKLFKQSCSVLLLFACLFVLFSPLSYATSSNKTIADRLQDLRKESSESSLAPLDELLPSEDVPAVFALQPDDISDGLVHIDFSAYQNGVLSSKLGINASDTPFSVKSTASSNTTASTLIEYVIDFSLNNASAIGLKNESFMLNLSNVWFALGSFAVASGSVFAELENYNPDFEVYADGVLLDGCSLSIIDSGSSGLVDISLSIDTPLPVNAYKISLKMFGTRSDLFPSYTGSNATRPLMYGIKNGLFSYTLLDSSSGFLASIIEWLRSIRDGISGVVSAIISLPGLIWDYIESGLQALFIPDQQQMIDFNNAMDELLAERLGALYQGTNMVVDFLMSLGTYEQQPTIRFPGLDMSDFGIPFVMEPQEVEIIPDAFDFVVDSIKFIVNVLATILFVNSLKRRLEKVFEGD